MSWLTDFLSALKPSSREEHFWAKIAGEEELENDTIPSSREEGFMYKIAQKVQGGSLPDASEASEGDVLTIDDGEPVWAPGGGGSGGGGAVYATFTETRKHIGGTDYVWVCDKTYAELKEAYDAGSIIVADVYSRSEWYGTLPMVFKRDGDLGVFAARLVYAVSSNGKVGFIGRASVAFISDETIQVQEIRTNNLDT